MQGFCTHPLAAVDINTGEHKPVSKRQYPIAYAQRHIIDNQINEWLEEGFVEKHNENTGYNNPLLITPKYDIQHNIKGWRVCIDPRLLN